jgi:2-dehydropantoate 2-reductase
MKIAVIGAGAIGGLVSGYLADRGADLSLIGHAQGVEAIRAGGLKIRGVRGEFSVALDVASRLTSRPDIVICATKTQDLEQAFRENLTYIKDAIVLTTQNGVRAEEIASRYVASDKLIPTIVMFGATSLNPGEVVHNFEGAWIMGAVSFSANASLDAAAPLCNTIFPVVRSADIRGMKHLKIFVNANNCIPALLGVSIQEAFSDQRISRISIAIWKEGMRIVQESGITLCSLPDFPLERLEKLVSMPLDEAAKIFSGIMGSLSTEPVLGSILQSIKRGKASEIDYINGEFVRLAQGAKRDAPLNTRLVELVHQVEKTRRFFTKDELIAETAEFIAADEKVVR